jgi:hypothetical protein
MEIPPRHLHQVGKILKNAYTEWKLKIGHVENKKDSCRYYFIPRQIHNWLLKGLQINLYLEQPVEIQLFATFFQRRK